MNRDFFENLFVLELANNHLGRVDRGLRIVGEYAQLVRFNNVRAAIKLQIRSVDDFVHPDWRHRDDIRYIKKTLDTKLSRAEYRTLVDAIRRGGCIPGATPFDEASVDLCVELGVEFIKIASSDINDWFLIERIAKTRKPVALSTGGSSLKDIDDIVTFFDRRGIPLAINHCVSIYPSEDSELELNQIDFLRERYAGHVIGLSTHEYGDWHSSMLIAYAKGARTFERHIDIDSDGVTASPYCTLPQQADEWFKAYHRAREMCGGSAGDRRAIPEKETRYLDSLVRGVYARRGLPAGHRLGEDDVFLAIPLQKGQISCREFMAGETLIASVAANAPIGIRDIDSPYARTESLRNAIENRGVDTPSVPPAALSSRRSAEVSAGEGMPNGTEPSRAVDSA